MNTTVISAAMIYALQKKYYRNQDAFQRIRLSLFDSLFLSLFSALVMSRKITRVLNIINSHRERWIDVPLLSIQGQVDTVTTPRTMQHCQHELVHSANTHTSLLSTT